MTYPKLTNELAVTGQISMDDLAAIKKAGFKAVINNRPDGEMPGQPKAQDMAEAASALGLTYVYIPVTSPPFPADAISGFADALEATDGPVLAHCRSGMRSTCLWAISQAGKHPPEALIEAAANAGYDIAGLAPLLQQNAD